MKKLIASILLIPCLLAASPSPPLRLDGLNRVKCFPPLFRMDSALNMSGSGQFSEQGLNDVLKLLPSEQVAIIDLREESHGFVNGIPFSWHILREERSERSAEEVAEDEEEKLQCLLKKGKAKAYELTRVGNGKNYTEDFKIKLKVREAIPERELAAKKNLPYLRIPAKDWGPMDNQHVDHFLSFIQGLPEGTWLHIHCFQGQLRTRLYMTLYAIFRQAKVLPFDEILAQQNALAGWAYSLDKPLHKNWVDFFAHFYLYCQEGSFQKKWSDWRLAQK